MNVVDDEFAGVFFGDCTWGDYDLDGDDDIVLSGAEDPFGPRIAIIYRNENNLRFAEEFRLKGLFFASLASGDYNADGDQEIVVTILISILYPMVVAFYIQAQRKFHLTFQFQLKK